jgi:hypothetical protein
VGCKANVRHELLGVIFNEAPCGTTRHAQFLGTRAPCEHLAEFVFKRRTRGELPTPTRGRPLCYSADQLSRNALGPVLRGDIYGFEECDERNLGSVDVDPKLGCLDEAHRLPGLCVGIKWHGARRNNYMPPFTFARLR